MLRLIRWLKRLRKRKQKKALKALKATLTADDTSLQTSNNSWTSYEFEGFAVIETKPVRKTGVATLAKPPSGRDTSVEYKLAATPPSACDACHIPTTTSCSNETPFHTVANVGSNGCGENGGTSISFANDLFATLSLTESVPQVEYLLNIAPDEDKRGPQTTPASASDVDPVLVDSELTVRQTEAINKRVSGRTLKRKGSKNTARLARSASMSSHALGSPKVGSLKQPQFLWSPSDTQLTKLAPAPTPTSSEDQTASISAPPTSTLSNSPHTASLEGDLLEAVDELIEAFPDTVRQWRAREAENEEVALANAALDLIEAYTEVLKVERRRSISGGVETVVRKTRGKGGGGGGGGL